MKYINVQGLSRDKFIEIENTIEKSEIYLLSETQQKIDKLKINENIINVSSMRNLNEKKGGGLMILFRRDNIFKIDYEKVETKSKDLLHVDFKIGAEKIKVILVYFSVHNSEINVKNRTIYEEISNIIVDCHENLMIIGDFNGHIDGLGYQRKDYNGKIVLELVNENNLLLMNTDEKCSGKYTWESGNKKSVIDYLLSNEKMYRLVEKVIVDEDKEFFDLSDHNMIKMEINIRHTGMNKGNQIVKEYLSTRTEDLDRFREDFSNKIREGTVNNIMEFNTLTENTAKETLEKKYVRREVNGKSMEPPWINNEIKKAIDKRKYINRNRRNTRNIDIRKQLDIEFHKQKEKVQQMVSSEIMKHEEKVTQEIIANKNKCKLWKDIAKLKGKESKDENVKLYDIEGHQILDEEKERRELRDVWQRIYKKEENNIEQAWNVEIRNFYESNRIRETISVDFGQNQVIIPTVLREHFDMAGTLMEEILNMDDLIIRSENVKNVIKNMKNKKCPGPDKMKVEIYKEIIKDEFVLEIMTIFFNQILEDRDIPRSWTKSITKMIPKISKPTARDLRPIALTDCTYKIFMSVLKESIENHIYVQNLQKDQQNGFTRGRRLEDNITILNYCIEGSLRTGQELYVAAVDYSKAFDSINRKQLIETLKRYNIDPRVIDIIARIYTQDMTQIHLRENLSEDMEIGNGIRQGCTASALLFKLVTFMIIGELEKEVGYKFRDFKINCLFFADDGLLIEQTEERMRSTLEKLIDISSMYGLEINKSKSNIIIYNRKTEKPTNIVDIPVVSEIKYLGIIICDKRNIFTEHKKKIIQKAQTMANQTYSIIYKSVNKMLIGSTFWKQVVLPSLLFGASNIIFNQEDILKLQRIENSVYRKILGAQRFAPIVTLRGEVGSSLMDSRIMKNKLSYCNYALNSENKILRRVMEEMVEGQYKWYKQVEGYMRDLDILDIKRENKNSIKQKVYALDTRKWREELETKSSLLIYRTYKTDIEQYQYKNNFRSSILYKLRSNTLNLEIRNRFKNESTICKMCNESDEDLFHFLLHCNKLDEIRRRRVELQRPIMESEIVVVGNFIFEEEEQIDDKMKIVEQMWKLRLTLINRL